MSSSVSLVEKEDTKKASWVLLVEMDWEEGTSTSWKLSKSNWKENQQDLHFPPTHMNTNQRWGEGLGFVCYFLALPAERT